MSGLETSKGHEVVVVEKNTVLSDEAICKMINELAAEISQDFLKELDLKKDKFSKIRENLRMMRTELAQETSNKFYGVLGQGNDPYEA